MKTIQSIGIYQATMCRIVTIVIICKSVFVGVQNHLQERNDHGEHHPHINHLEVGGGGQTLGDAKKTEEEKLKAKKI